MPKPLALPARRALRNLGADIRAARLRRRIPLELLAQRGLTSRATMGKVEKGDPSVAIGVYANALHALGLIDRLGTVAAPAHDPVGMALEEERLPKRVRLRKRRDGESS